MLSQDNLKLYQRRAMEECTCPKSLCPGIFGFCNMISSFECAYNIANLPLSILFLILTDISEDKVSLTFYFNKFVLFVFMLFFQMTMVTVICLYKCMNENQHQRERNNTLLVYLRSQVAYEAKGHGYNDTCLFYQNKFKKKNYDNTLFYNFKPFYCQHFFEYVQNSFSSGFFSLRYTM